MTDETTTTPPRLGVVTVSYGSDDVLPGLLASIPAAAGGADAVVVVVDNLPSEGDSEGIARRFGATYVPLPENPGYGGAMNAGVAMLPASVEWVLIVNPDVALDAGSIAALVAYGAAHPDAGSVGPLVRNPDGTAYPSARAVPSLRTGVGHALIGPVWAGNPWTRAYRKDSTETPALRDAGWLSGACVLVRRRVFDEIGGFDEGYFMYFEDVDLGARIGRAGYRNVYEPAAAVTHEGGHSTGRASERMIIAHHDSARRFLSKKYPGPLLWPIRASLSLGLRMRGALAIRRARRASN
ncbi:glycosyltransferase family 2 protein [Salinibacterium sp. ZJ70]|uniref:glycosyltransferase family 2 protein n=1 Tax=Salinibacterium sp. ZJ70 TaxID=2708084 RepID=UPI00174D2B60|nr:glycosyltransferase family 2 protein [Salinibacterium sp. ZJ70]